MLMISYVILKYAPYDWLKYRGMAILVCRKKNRCRIGIRRSTIYRRWPAIFCLHLYTKNLFLTLFSLKIFFHNPEFLLYRKALLLKNV